MKISVFPNLGNTCYLNSVLQCFINNQTFQDFLKKYDHPFVNELKKITIDLTDNDEHMACIFNVKDILEYFSFRKFEQQDAHECIIQFLELLIKETPYPTPILNVSTSWDKLDTSPYVPMYHGQTKTYISCSKCKNVKHVFEEFNTIHLTIPLENTLKIRESLSGEIREYNLKSIINHTGNLYNGHYTSYVMINGKSLFIDDESVKLSEYTCKDAYILFYEC